MLAVETATRELLEVDEHIEVLQLPPASRDFLSRRTSNVEMRTAAAPRYVSPPFRYRNSGPGLSLPTETPMFKLIEIEEGDSTIYDPPLQVIQGSNEHRTFAIICKLLDAEAAQISDEQKLNETRALLVLQLEMLMKSDCISQGHISGRNKRVIQRLGEIRERLKAAHVCTLRGSETPIYLPAAQARARYASVDAYVNIDDWRDTEILLHDRV
jgi:hypothetical protein